MVPAVFVELLSIRIGSPLSAESVTRSEKSCSFDCQSEPPTLYQARTRACHATHKMSRTHLLHQPLSEWRVLDNILGSEYMSSGFADRSRSVHRGPTLKLAAEATKSGGVLLLAVKAEAALVCLAARCRTVHRSSIYRRSDRVPGKLHVVGFSAEIQNCL